MPWRACGCGLAIHACTEDDALKMARRVRAVQDPASCGSGLGALVVAGVLQYVGVGFVP